MYSSGIFYEASGVAVKVWVTSQPQYNIKEPFTEEEFNAIDPSDLNGIKERLKKQLIAKMSHDWVEEWVNAGGTLNEV